jgi:hypothetical protein
MKEFTRVFVRDSGVGIDVGFTITPGTPETGWSGPPENYDCGSPAEVDVTAVNGCRLAARDLTDAERERFAAEVLDDVGEYLDDGPDPDDARDRMRDDRLTDR